MANPRQRRKARSSSYKPVSHSRHANRNLKKTTIRGPKVLQEGWDRRKTVRQNYTALGLIHTLNPSSSGGVEPIESISERDGTQGESISQNTHESASIPKGFGRITRDAAGQVLAIEMAEGEEEKNQADVELDMEALSPRVDEAILEKWTGTTQTKGGCQNVVQALEGISRRTVASGRHCSVGELGYLKKLVERYGEDVEGMAKDRKMNPEQRTAGELRRALWRAGDWQIADYGLVNDVQ